MKRYAATFAVLALVIGSGQAQEKGKGGKGGFGGRGGFGSPTALLENKDVQKDLKLDTKQVAKVEELGKAYKEKTADLKGKEGFAKSQEVRTEIKKEVDALLTADQAKRVKQLQLRQRGASAILSKEVSEELKITDDQKTKIEETLKGVREKRSELFKGFKDDKEGTTKKLADLSNETLATVVKGLTADQQKTYNQLIGPAFEGTLPTAGGFGGGFGGGGVTPRKKGDAPKKVGKIL